MTNCVTGTHFPGRSNTRLTEWIPGCWP
uniref:Uncharacterized protein n=1 Tax=Rhizophora mucronata TaxID=61149 RepID=A0A2P2J023_RHIMU